MKTSSFLIMATAIVALAACNDKKPANNNNDNTQQPVEQSEKAAEEETGNPTTATIDGIGTMANWDMGIMNISKNNDEFVVSATKGELKLTLKPEGNGVYQETSPKKEMIGQGARFVAQKVGDITTLTAYNGETIALTLIECNDLKAFRNRGYKRMLTSKFEPTKDGLITITDDTMRGPILPDSPDMNYFFIEDGNGDLTDKIRLSPGRWHMAFAPADKGVNLHYCNMIGETGELEVNYGDENTIRLQYAEDPGWKWLSTDVLDMEFLIYNFDKPYWQLMLNKLKAIKQPNEVEQWNRNLIDNLLTHGNEPYTGLESTIID